MPGSQISRKSSASHRSHQSSRSAKYSNTTTSSTRDLAYAAGVREGEQRAKLCSASGSVSGSVRSYAAPPGSQPQGSQAMSNKAGHMAEVSNTQPLREIAAQAKEEAGSRSGYSEASGSSRRSRHGGGEITRKASLGNTYGSMMQNARGVPPTPTRDRPKVTEGAVRVRVDPCGCVDMAFWEEEWYE